MVIVAGQARIFEELVAVQEQLRGPQELQHYLACKQAAPTDYQTNRQHFLRQVPFCDWIVNESKYDEGVKRPKIEPTVELQDSINKK